MGGRIKWGLHVGFELRGGSENPGCLGQLHLGFRMGSTHLTHPRPSASVQSRSLSNPILQSTGSFLQRPGQIPTGSSKGSSETQPPLAIPESTGSSSQGSEQKEMGLSLRCRASFRKAVLGHWLSWGFLAPLKVLTCGQEEHGRGGAPPPGFPAQPPLLGEEPTRLSPSSPHLTTTRHDAKPN